MRAICLLVVISIAPRSRRPSRHRAISRPRIGARPIVAQFGGSKVPSAVAELIGQRWRFGDASVVISSCYPSEQQAVEAARHIQRLSFLSSTQPTTLGSIG